MKRTLISGTVLALAVAGMSTGNAAPAVHKVTGGGQITSATQTGAGSTIAFTAQSQGAEGSAAKGQFQLQLRNATTGAKETVHGTVTCVVVFATEDGMPAMAAIGGQSRGGEDFRIDVTDDGQGRDAMDMVSVRRGDAARDGRDMEIPGAPMDESLCDSEDEMADMSLGRGNVKIHKAKATEAGAGNGKGNG